MTNFNYISDYELKRATPYSAGFDLKCVRVAEENNYLVNLYLGVKVMFETEEDMRNHKFSLTQRSSFAKKYGLVMANRLGVIDADYQGELVMQCYRIGLDTKSVPMGDTVGGITPCIKSYVPIIEQAEQCLDQYVAQLVPVKTMSVLTFPNKVAKFNITTTRGEGGFGSTG